MKIIERYIREDKIILIQTNKGDCKFSDGCVKELESYSQALLREVVEESEYSNCIVKDRIGSVQENQIDIYNQNSYFQMVAHYYLCLLGHARVVEQQLDAYEIDLDFKFVWISLEDAIPKNEGAMFKVGSNPWVKRENIVLKKLVEESVVLKDLVN